MSLLCSGPGPCVGEAAQPEKQAGEQTGEHRSEEDADGTPVRGSGTGTRGWILERKRSAGLGDGLGTICGKCRGRIKRKNE